jgi:hypothetical protein
MFIVALKIPLSCGWRPQCSWIIRFTNEEVIGMIGEVLIMIALFAAGKHLTLRSLPKKMELDSVSFSFGFC